MSVNERFRLMDVLTCLLCLRFSLSCQCEYLSIWGSNTRSRTNVSFTRRRQRWRRPKWADGRVSFMGKNHEKELSHRRTLEGTESNYSNTHSTRSKHPFDVKIKSIKGSRSCFTKACGNWKRYMIILVNMEFTGSQMWLPE